MRDDKRQIKMNWDDLARKSFKEVQRSDFRTEAAIRKNIRKKNEASYGLVDDYRRVFQSKISGFILLFCLFLGKSVVAVPQNVKYHSVVGPFTVSASTTVGNSGTFYRNCFTNIAVVSDSNGTFRILSGATTTYSLAITSNAVHVNEFGADDPFCTTQGSTTTLKVDNGNFSINTHGYKY